MALIFEPGALRELFGSQYNSIHTLPIDVTVRESHTLPSQVTEKPVEDGSVISDTTVLQNSRLSISGIFGDSTDKSWGEKWQELQEIRRLRVPFSVVTSLGTYDRMIFTSISANRDAMNTGALFFDADLVQIRIISGESVRVPAGSVKNSDARAPKQDAGKKQAQAKTEAESNTVGKEQAKSVDSSWAADLYDWAAS